LFSVMKQEQIPMQLRNTPVIKVEYSFRDC
jgi:hypothetical protein